MKKILNNLANSFTTDKMGYSARKLSAFVGVVVAIYVTAKELPQVAMLHALYAWLCFALLCLGIVTIEQIINLKNGKDESKPTPEA